MTQEELIEIERAYRRPVPRGTLHLPTVVTYTAAHLFGRHLREPVQVNRYTDTNELFTVPSFDDMQEQCELFEMCRSLLLYWLKVGDLEVLIGDTNKALPPAFWCSAGPENITAGLYQGELLVIERAALDAFLKKVKLVREGNGAGAPADLEAVSQPVVNDAGSAPHHDAAAVVKPPSEKKLYRFLLDIADGEKTKNECRAAAEKHFGVPIGDGRRWRAVWNALPKGKKRPVGKRRHPKQVNSE